MHVVTCRTWRVSAVIVVMALLVLVSCAARKKKEPLTPEETYALAIEKLKKKKYYKARSLLQEVLPRIPPEDRDLLPKVQVAIADTYFEDGGLLNYGEALNAYRSFLTYFPDNERADHAQFMLAMSLFKQVLAPDRDQSLTREAIGEFRKVENVYPDSTYVTQTRRKIEEGFDLLAEHERLIGWFYQKRKIWAAAIDRYRTVLIEYPRYTGRQKVLFDLGRCLLATGKRNEAQAFFSRLAQESPDGRMTREAEKLLKKDARRRAREEAKQQG